MSPEATKLALSLAPIFHGHTGLDVADATISHALYCICVSHRLDPARGMEVFVNYLQTTPWEHFGFDPTQVRRG